MLWALRKVLLRKNFYALSARLYLLNPGNAKSVLIGFIRTALIALLKRLDSALSCVLSLALSPSKMNLKDNYRTCSSFVKTLNLAARRY